jgi:hypothetical protein
MLAMLAPSSHPAAQPHLFAHVLLAEHPAQVSAERRGSVLFVVFGGHVPSGVGVGGDVGVGG